MLTDWCQGKCWGSRFSYFQHIKCQKASGRRKTLTYATRQPPSLGNWIQSEPMPRLLVATPEPIGRRLAGPAIRAAQIARVLAHEHDVTLVSLAGDSVSPIDGRTVFGPDLIDDRYDAAIVQGSVLYHHPELVESSMPLAIDWFDPFHVEALHRGGADRIKRIDVIDGAHATLREQGERGDFFVCSNDAQRDHWLGWLAAAGRLNERTHDEHPLFESLIATAPFGVGVESPARTSPIRETFSAIGRYDPVLVWAGGLHDWLDPLLVINALPFVLEENPDTRLVFLAGPHPNTSIEIMGIRGEAIALAREKRLFGRHVFFVNQWIDYSERLAWVADATIGVVADREHLESTLSHRTRLLDHLTVGLPTVTTNGDPMGQFVTAGGAGVATERTEAAFGSAIAELINDDTRLGELGRAGRSLAAGLSWEQTLRPLIDWAKNPRPAVDRSRPKNDRDARSIGRVGDRIKLHLDDGGAKQVIQRGFEAGKRRLGK